jgi:hypothetical protein
VSAVKSIRVGWQLEVRFFAAPQHGGVPGGTSFERSGEFVEQF